MKGWLMDVYRKKNSVVLWIKTPEQDFKIEKPFTAEIYIHTNAEHFLKKNSIDYMHVRKKTYMRTYKHVLKLPLPNLECFERFIRDIERGTRHRIPLYNADIKPEQMFLYKHNLIPCSSVQIEDNNILPLPEEYPIPLKKLRLQVFSSGDISRNHEIPVQRIEVSGIELAGTEKEILTKFSEHFKQNDPDVIIMDYAFSRLPYLATRLERFKIDCPFHRWDAVPIIYRGGRSYWSYGQVRYQDYAIRLRGRFLVDTNSFIGTECEPEAIVELTQLSGTLFQHLASRSFGAVFQTALMREMIRQGMLVPFKEKPLDNPLSMLDMLKTDRAGFTFDPKSGFHKDVAEIDFVSMFPWLIYNHNISADCILSDEGPFAHIPNSPLKTSMRYKGLIPTALKPFIDRRMYYKKHPTAVNKERARGLKWVLVSCYGYLRFREFKLGIPTSHMAIGVLARETILQVIHLAEEKGFEVVHAIVDCLYIHKKNLSEEEVKDFCKEIEIITGIPIQFEGIFKWVVFLPSVLDKERPLPSTYYGVFRQGDIKVRGIEVRQRSVPEVVKMFQHKILELMKECSAKKEIIEKVPDLCKYLRYVIKLIPQIDRKYLIATVRVAKTDYKHTIPQKIIVEKLQKHGVSIMPGQFIHFIFQKDGIVLPEEYNGIPDVEHYKDLLIRALFVVLQPFGYSKKMIMEEAEFEKQMRIQDYTAKIKVRYFSLQRKYASNKGLSEYLIKKRLERQGWMVWKGGLIGILRNNKELYPSVVRKYAQLNVLLHTYHPGKLEHLEYINAVHHGMPDYICFRNGSFMFVECKLQYETLSSVQKKCIHTLKNIGFEVEVHKIVDHRTKAIEAVVDNGTKRILVKQLVLRANNF